MELGFLGIPKADALNDLTGEIFLKQYQDYLHEDYALQVKRSLLKDTRVQSLLNRSVATGTHFVQFDIDALWKWLLWRKNEVGHDSAESELDKYLNSGETTIEAAYWVAGIQVDEKLEISDGIFLVPVSDMVYSREKSFYSISEGHSFQTVSVPRCACALVKTLTVPRDYPLEYRDDDGRAREYVAITHASILRLLLVLSLMGLVSHACAYPVGHNFYYPDGVPFGPFDPAWCSSIYPYEGWGTDYVRFGRGDIEELRELLFLFDKNWRDDSAILDRSLTRLSLAKRRPQFEDRVLDMCIALEMLLLQDSGSKEQLSMTFRLRGTWLLGGNQEERARNVQLFKNLYSYRSSVAHGGEIRDKKFWKDPIANTQELFSLTERVIKAYIAKGRLSAKQWETLLIGGSA